MTTLLCLALAPVILIAAHWADRDARAGIDYDDVPHSRDLSKK